MMFEHFIFPMPRFRYEIVHNIRKVRKILLEVNSFLITLSRDLHRILSCSYSSTKHDSNYTVGRWKTNAKMEEISLNVKMTPKKVTCEKSYGTQFP